jgi:predicted P-loop ATPase/GTPase
MFTEKIENTNDEIRNEYINKRNLLLKVTQEIDQQLEQRLAASRLIIDNIINNDNPDEALLQNLGSIDQFFIQGLSAEIEIAGKQKLTERKTKLENLLNKIQELTTPPEMKVLEKLLDLVENEKKLNDAVDEIDDQLSSELIDYLTSILGQYEERLKGTSENDRQEIEDTLKKIKLVYNSVLKRSMKMKLSAK